MKMNVEGKSGRGRPKNRLLDTTENDLTDMGDFSVCIGDVENREKWRCLIEVADPKQLGER